ncbi:TolC family protein [Polyangium sp. 15x6]|uniref:TolC family protein n=1 Tax=Polyangium sp. 15x6 TaxID=3042687 RepID=UPI00249AD833|nr:TolC family protein [Polyangium sp. 15x6]MDI3286376.1 TolC family protein [Polyangium sp. 15x6]
MLRPRWVRASLATPLLSFALLVSAPLAAQPAAPQPAQPAPAPAAPAVPPTIAVDDPLLAPVPTAPKTLATWREAVTIVETRAPDLRIAEAEVARAEGLSTQALGRALPTVTATGSVNHNMILSDGRFLFCPVGPALPTNDARTQGTCVIDNTPAQYIPLPYTPILRGDVTARVPILSLRNWYAIGTANKNVDAARASASDRRRQLLANLAAAIVNVVTTERTSEINRSGLRTSLERLELTKRRARLGTGTQLDVVRAEQDTNLARTQIVQSDESLRRAREALGLALGENVAYGVPPSISLDDMKHSIESTCSAGKPEDRPDVVAARQQLEVAKRQARETRLGFLPTAEATTTLTAMNLGQGNLKNYTWTIGAVLTIPIYEGSRYGEVRTARAAVEQQEARLEAAERQARLDTQQTMRGVEVAEQALVISEKARDLARETARLTQIAYEAGTATSFELVTSAQSLRQAELDLAVRELELVRARIAALLAAAVCDG